MKRSDFLKRAVVGIAGVIGAGIATKTAEAKLGVFHDAKNGDLSAEPIHCAFGMTATDWTETGVTIVNHSPGAITISGGESFRNQHKEVIEEMNRISAETTEYIINARKEMIPCRPDPIVTREMAESCSIIDRR